MPVVGSVIQLEVALCCPVPIVNSSKLYQCSHEDGICHRFHFFRAGIQYNCKIETLILAGGAENGSLGWMVTRLVLDAHVGIYDAWVST
jgi:hypothetical protein